MQKMRGKSKRTAVAVVIALAFMLPYLSHAADDDASATPSGWWTRQEEGWFFYNDRDETPPLEQEEEQESAAGASGGEPLFTEKMERLGKELMSRAVESPTESNVRAYMEHNKAMLAASDNFSKMWQKVIMKYPHLLYESGLTHSTKDIEAAIVSLKNQAGIYFIHSSTCDSCRKQAAVLEEFSNKHGMSVFPVTLDGGNLPEFPNAVSDNGMAAQLGVKSVPAIFLAFPADGRIERIAEGFIDRFDLERRLYNYAVPIDTEEVATLFDSAGYNGSGGAAGR
jgi:conjugal transfer pilus assembly protein TraF